MAYDRDRAAAAARQQFRTVAEKLAAADQWQAAGLMLRAAVEAASGFATAADVERAQHYLRAAADSTAHPDGRVHIGVSIRIASSIQGRLMDIERGGRR